uniref:Galectin domain-containing protein n=1 Tax=Globodera rostochiensis TaxID=31243 RepID=A0A914HQQ0_GLORO
MNAHLTLAINFFCLLALLHGTQSKMKTKPTRLTGQSTNDHIIPVALLDQCFPYEESKTFGLEFRLPEIGGRCDKGMLICYPSTLITHPLDNKHIVNGMSVNSELFNVDSASKNSLAKECEQLLTGFSNKKHKDKAFWRGIQVYTVKKSDGTIAMKLNTSLVGQGHGHSFEIPQAQRQFIIHLGNEREMFTYVTIDKGEPVEVEGEKAKREAYKQLAPRGARLKDFVGLWTLGLDMLPWMNHTMRLYVQRSCDCFMEAWFIRPTDSEPADLKEPTRGSAQTECSKEAKTDLIVSLKNNPLKANHLIHIRLMASEFTRNVTFKLYASGWKYHIALMSFNISRAGSNVFMRNATSRHMNGGWHIPTRLPDKDGSYQLEFRIALTKYSYGIMIGGIVEHTKYHTDRLGATEFFPPYWWQGLQFNLMDHYQLGGEFLLLNDPPPVMAFKNIEQNYEPVLITDFETTIVRNLQIGSILTFRVKPRNPNAYTFTISLLHNRPEEHPTIGKTVLKIQVYPNKLQLSSNFVDVKKSYSNKAIVVPAIKHDLLEVNITVFSNHYMFMMNGMKLPKNRTADLPIWATNNVLIEGDIDQLGPPHIDVPPASVENNRRDFTKFTKKLHTLLNYNDNITIDMEIYNTSNNFSIYLMNESLEPSKRIGHVVLALNFTVSETTSTQCKYHLHQNGLDEMESNGSDFPNMTSFGHQVDNRLNRNGQRFNMTIKCEENRFVINIDEVDFVALNCPYPTIKDNITMPPWSVDHIQIVGDVYVYALHIEQPEISTPEFLTEVNHAWGVLRQRDRITVHAVINKKLNETLGFNVTVNLFYEALQHHALVGKTVMSTTFNEHADGQQQQLIFSSYDNGKKGERTNTTGFNVTLNDVYVCPHPYMDGLPTWAVHYITIESTNVKLDNATNITCKPQKRCKRPSDQTGSYRLED